MRLMRAFTGRDIVLKIEGSYHGHHDALMVSVAPPANKIGPYDDPVSVPQTLGLPADYVKLTKVVPFNDLDALERTLEKYRGQVAGMIVEPAMMNAGIVLPEDGYLAGVKALLHAHGALLAFDEVKTGATITLRRRHQALRRHARRALPGQVGRRRPALRRPRRLRGGHELDRRRQDRPGRHVQRQPADDGRHAGDADRDPDARRLRPSSTGWPRSCATGATPSSSTPGSPATPP